MDDIIEFRKDIPSKEYLISLWEETRAPSLLVLDDQMSNLSDNRQGAHVADRHSTTNKPIELKIHFNLY